jgi:hypothetical protein
MKIIKTALILSVMGLSLSTTANATSFSAGDSSKASNLCLTAVQGSKIAMHFEIKGSGWSKQHISDNVQCNNQSIGKFIAKYGSDSMKSFIPASTDVKIIDLARAAQYSGRVNVVK